MAGMGKSEDTRRKISDIALASFQERGYEALPKEWLGVAEISTVNVRLTSAQLADLGKQWERFMDEYLTPLRGHNPPGSRPVQIHFNAFPVIDGDVTPNSPEKEA